MEANCKSVPLKGRKEGRVSLSLSRSRLCTLPLAPDCEGPMASDGCWWKRTEHWLGRRRSSRGWRKENEREREKESWRERARGREGYGEKTVSSLCGSVDGAIAPPSCHICSYHATGKDKPEKDIIRKAWFFDFRDFPKRINNNKWMYLNIVLYYCILFFEICQLVPIDKIKKKKKSIRLVWLCF